MKTEFENPTEEQKELIRYWIKKMFKENITKQHQYDWIEKHLSPKPKIEVGKWYKSTCSNGVISYCYCSHPDFTGYGFNSSGEWVEKNIWLKFKESWKEATEKEVEERLIQEAIKRGYKPGNFKCLGNWDNSGQFLKGNAESFTYEKESPNPNSLWIHNIHTYSLLLFHNGKWAEIIDENKEVKEAIARMEAELETLKKQVK